MSSQKNPRGDDHGEIATLALADVVPAGDVGQLGVVRPHPDDAVDNADGRGHGSVVAYHLLDPPGYGEVVRAGQPMADNRALERDHGPAGGDTGGYLGTYRQRRHRPQASAGREE